MPDLKQERLVRCALLNTAQWALDCKQKAPSASDFRNKFGKTLKKYFVGLQDLNNHIEVNLNGAPPQILHFNVPATQLNEGFWDVHVTKKPNLVLTSPPYPGVHILYHRWQIKGRRETPAPFWISGQLDGKGLSYYTMGSRTPTGINNYFESIQKSFAHIHKLLSNDALVVQLIAFSNIENQLPRYLDAMRMAGFEEYSIATENGQVNERIWREVPCRRWYASFKGNTHSSRELLLIHKRI